jgi:hypothetical protein
MEAEIERQGVRAAPCGKRFSREALYWVVGVANMLAILALFILAVVKTPASVRVNNARCLQQVANQEHVALEAFFQNPTEQDALAQAVAVCAR